MSTARSSTQTRQRDELLSNNPFNPIAAKTRLRVNETLDFMNGPLRLLLTVILCTSLGHAESPDWKGQLGDAEVKWHNRGVVDYRMTVKVSCIFCPVGLPETHELRVTVSSGLVTSIENASVQEQSLHDYSTVPGLFNLIEWWTRGGPEVVDLSFDPKYGFPRSIRIDPDASATDDELIVEVQAFQAVE